MRTYESKTWEFNPTTEDTIAVTQREIEQIMLSITIHDRKSNTWIPHLGVKVIIKAIKKGKHRWAAHGSSLHKKKKDFYNQHYNKTIKINDFVIDIISVHEII